ncbi:MAG: NUMOD4 motif-containing HNH endonuclease [Candidatus Peribacteraceae bacterium]|nr:NUMOD4 motif-containing HNH endonuclease [Candidatus Peribacteraceae bacterium]
MEKKPEWKPIPGYEGYYEVSSDGKVRSVERVIKDEIGRVSKKKSYMKKIYKGHDGYSFVFLHKDSSRIGLRVHKLVLLAFNGPRPEGMQTRHLDGSRTNNSLSNLRYGTAKENYEDARRHGTNCSGERNGNSRLTWETVNKIREEYESGQISQRKLGVKYGVGQHAIWSVVNGKRWVRK